jgi:hypothetical protein
MKLFLQFGYGMMDLCCDLCSKWGGGTIILSPRDIKPERLSSQAQKMAEVKNVDLLVDPQFYLPRANHDTLTSHDYFPKEYETGSFFSGPNLNTFVQKIVDLNSLLATRAIILPGHFTETVSDEWLAAQAAIAASAKAATKDRHLIATIALGAPALKDEEQVHSILDEVKNWGVQAVYLVLQRSDGAYFNVEPIWMANALDLIAGLRLQGLEVIVGYSNQQFLIAACAGATAIAAGTWRNVRVFATGKFNAAEEEIKRKAVWYYCSQAFSEFKTPMLDVARRVGLLDLMAPPGPDGEFAHALFSGAPPTSVAFSEPDAFRHYLNCLRSQVHVARQATFRETLEAQLRVLGTAEQLLKGLHERGVVGEERDFEEAISTNRTALSLLKEWRGPILDRDWSRLQ